MIAKATHAGLLTVLVCVGHAVADNPEAVAADADSDGVLSLAEVQNAWPETTAQVFAAMDLNADGVLDGRELKPAQEAGLLPDRSGGT